MSAKHAKVIRDAILAARQDFWVMNRPKPAGHLMTIFADRGPLGNYAWERTIQKLALNAVVSP